MSARKLVYTALLAALTAAGAFIRIPIGISVITLQFLFTAMAGVLLGPGGGALSQGVYVALGLVGLPSFTAGGGFGDVLRPSFNPAVRVDVTLGELLDRALQQSFIPVVDDRGAFVGIVTRQNIIRKLTVPKTEGGPGEESEYAFAQ